jgi:hypothetical protein
MNFNEQDSPSTYRIMIKENLEATVTDWFGGLTFTPLENGGTLLTGSFPDQPALRGFLDQLWNLNFTVLSVDRIENQNHPAFDPEEQQSGDRK